jgi:hypothetical protein
MEEIKTKLVLEYLNKDRTVKIISTKWIKVESPYKFCSTCHRTEDQQGIRQKDGSRP